MRHAAGYSRVAWQNVCRHSRVWNYPHFLPLPARFRADFRCCQDSPYPWQQPECSKNSSKKQLATWTRQMFTNANIISYLWWTMLASVSHKQEVASLASQEFSQDYYTPPPKWVWPTHLRGAFPSGSRARSRFDSFHSCASNYFSTFRHCPSFIRGVSLKQTREQSEMVTEWRPYLRRRQTNLQRPDLVTSYRGKNVNKSY